MSKKANLQPWIEYVRMLHTYEQRGFLDVNHDKHEAYVTRAAMFTLVGTDVNVPPDNVFGHVRLMRKTHALLRRLRAYAGYKSQTGGDYLLQDFAVHMVEDSPSREPICTILISRRRKWYRLWRRCDDVEFITYDNGM